MLINQILCYEKGDIIPCLDNADAVKKCKELKSAGYNAVLDVDQDIFTLAVRWTVKVTDVPNN